ncbi:MAG: hypothetical protein NUV72_02600, partial [Bauldia sp.]|nr:hypothetical protein [Bauldia sp.]
AGPLTRLGGGIVRPEVTAAMAEAATASVDMATLQAHASQTIARLTGAEAGCVTSGAAAGLLLATAACVTGLDRARMDKLPDTAGMKNEIVMLRGQRNGYDHAVRAAGIKLVEVGLLDRQAGAGVRGPEAADIAEAITAGTAAVFHVADRFARPALADVVAVAREAGVPVIVDAAARLPPQSNLTRLIADGADLVAFSGGKAIGGPQASGILCGRRDLIMAATLQTLDLDCLPEFWEPPPTLIDKSRLGGLPRQGIGRTCKVGKEEIIGLLTALDLFVAEGDGPRHARWLAEARRLANGIRDHGRVEIAVLGEDDTGEVPVVEIRFPRGAENEAVPLIKALQHGAPPVYVDQTLCYRGIVTFSPVALQPGEAELVARRISSLLRG